MAYARYGEKFAAHWGFTEKFKNKTDKKAVRVQRDDFPDCCYKFTRTGPVLAGGIWRMKCSQCRSINDKAYRLGQPTVILESVPIEGEARGDWLTDPKQYPHICGHSEPKKITADEGTELSRSHLASLKEGRSTKVGKAGLGILNKAVEARYSHLTKEQRDDIIKSSFGRNLRSTQRTMYRARGYRFPDKIKKLEDVTEETHPELFYTLRGSELKKQGQEVPETERLLRYKNHQMAIFISDQMGTWTIEKVKRLFCDGNFKYAPKGYLQVYRIFGIIGNTSVPLITVILDGKSERLYTRMWKHIAIYLRSRCTGCDNNLQCVHGLEMAHFDCEHAVINAFKKYFPGVAVKMCVFHVKQALHRRLQKLGLQSLYHNDETVSEIVRMIGALQIFPETHIRKAVKLLTSYINNADLQNAVRRALSELLIYYKKTWIKCSLGFNFFTAWDVAKHRTTNHAESYHSKLAELYEKPRPSLGKWLVYNQEICSLEERLTTRRLDGTGTEPIDMRTREVDKRIKKAKRNLREFLSGRFTPDEFEIAVTNYLCQMGHLMGFNRRANGDNEANEDNETNGDIDEDYTPVHDDIEAYPLVEIEPDEPELVIAPINENIQRNRAKTVRPPNAKKQKNITPPLDDEEQNDVPELIAPVQRKNRRPGVRAVTPPIPNGKKANTRAKKNNKPANTKTKQITQAAQSTEQVIPRKLRPTTLRNSRDSLEDVTIEQEPTSSTAVSEHNGTQQMYAIQTMEIQTSASVSTVAKKGRGRPRKIPLAASTPENHSHEDLPTFQDNSTLSPIPRKRKTTTDPILSQPTVAKNTKRMDEASQQLLNSQSQHPSLDTENSYLSANPPSQIPNSSASSSNASGNFYSSRGSGPSLEWSQMASSQSGSSWGMDCSQFIATGEPAELSEDDLQYLSTYQK